MSAFDALPQCSFAGIPFPYESIEIPGGVRDHVHEYSHTDGGDPEKLGRKLYTFRITASFQATFKKYVNLYPDSLNVLLRKFESSTTDDLVVPQFGTVRAYAVSWNRSASARIRSGEKVTIEFREDGGQIVLDTIIDNAPLEIQSAAAVLIARVKEAPTAGNSLAAAQQDGGLTGSDRNVFDSITDLSNAIFAIQDTADLSGQLLAAKVEQLASICARADGLRSMQSTGSQPLVQALHDLWKAALRIADDVQSKQRLMQQYVVPFRMTMTEIATALYHDASRVNDLLSLNSGRYVDALAVPAGTGLVYYPDA